MSSIQIDDHPATGNEPGLSSAMHDIRMIAKRYQNHGAQTESKHTLELGGVSMNPSFLLVPQVTSRRESWKGVALAMMVLLGLSTSALALTLYANADEPSIEVVPPSLQLDGAALGPLVEAGPAIVMSPEPAIYSVTSAPGSTARPELRDAKAPISTGSAIRQSPLGAGRKTAEAANTCDEVACLLDGSDACCQQYESVRSSESELKDAPARPYRPSRNEIMKPMSSISGRVATCSSNYGYQGMAMVKVVISPDGIPSSITLDDGSEAFQACVESVVRELRFPQLSQPFTFSYPFSR